MGLPTLIVLLCLILWDIANLKKIHAEVTASAFSRANAFTVAILLAVGYYFYLTQATLSEIFLSYTGIVFTVYMYCREKISSRIFGFRQYAEPPTVYTYDFLHVILVWMFGSLMFGLVMFNVGALFPGWVNQFDELLYTTIFSTALVLFLIDESAAKIDDKGFLFHVGLDGKKRSTLTTVILPLCVGFVFALSSVAIIFSRDIPVQTPLADLLENVASPVAIIIFFFLATIVAPLAEEIIFRGYCFNMLSRIKGTRLALYATSLSFAVMHVGQYWGDWMAISIITLLGFVLTLFRIYTRTTLSSIVLHYAYNGSVALISGYFIMRDNPQMFEAIVLLR